MSNEISSLLRALVQLSGRAIYDEETIVNIIGPKSKKLKSAYNMCDGTRTQREVTKAVGLDSGNFSRTVTRWIQKGIIFRLDYGDRITLMHVFPV